MEKRLKKILKQAYNEGAAYALKGSETYSLDNFLKDKEEQLRLCGVGSSNKVDYKQGFELAQKYIEESPCDPDIYRTQLDAWNNYQQFLIDNNIT